DGVEGEVVALFHEVGTGDRLANRVRGDRNGIRTGRRDDLGRGQVLRQGEGPLVVADRPLSVLDRLRRAFVAGGALADAALEGLPGALAPRVAAGGVEVSLEVV